jgi:hypothetical protein
MKFQDFLNEKKVTLKRRYTENHPAMEAGLTARVRNKMIEAVADGKLTQEEFNSILSELSNDSKRWMTRNAKYFNVSEEGITLSRFGKRVLKTFAINENEGFILESTRSQIGIIDRRGVIHSTYVHSDGYPEGVGQMAKDHFSDTKKMKELLKLGKNGISYLEPGIEGGEGHHFNTPIDGQTVFYGRDRGETKYDMTQKRKLEDLDDYLQDVAYDGSEYVYLWDEKEKEWKYAVAKTKDGRQLGLQVLESELIEEDVVEEGRNAFVTAARAAKAKGLKEFEFKGKTFPVTVKDVSEEAPEVEETEGNGSAIEESTEKVNEANASSYIKAGKLGYDDQFLGKQSLSMTLSLDLGFNKKHQFGGGDWIGFDYISMYASGSKSGTILNDALTGKYTYEELKAAAAAHFGIKESEEPAEEVVETEKLVFESFADFVSSLNMSVNETRFYAIFQGSKHEIEAKDLYDAKKKAIAELKIKKKDQGLLSIVNADQHDDFSKGKNMDFAFEGEELNEAFKSAKLQQLFNTKVSSEWSSRSMKQLPKAFYGMTQIALDKVEDEDLIDMENPREAHGLDKKGKGRYVTFYIVDQDKKNPHAPAEGYTTIPAGIIAIVRNNNFQGVTWASTYGRNNAGYKGQRLSSTTDGGVGISKKYKGWDGTGLYNPKRIADVADRAIMLDINALQDKYSTMGKRADREAARKGATAFKSDKDFKQENIKRYKQILADKAAKLPLDKMVNDAIEMLTAQIKYGLESGETNNGEPILGYDPKGRPVRMRDASNHMSNILDDYADYVRYSNEAQTSIGDYYAGRVKEEAKSIKDRINKIATMNYVW